MKPRPPLGTLAALAALAFAACADGAGPGTVPPMRPSDGILSDAELQAVVDLQVTRDGGALMQRLSHPRAAMRARAAFALASVQDPSATPALVSALADSSASVRRDAAFALGQAGDSVAVGPLLGAFASEADGEVRRRVLEALGKIRSMEGARGLAALTVGEAEEAERVLAIARQGATRMIIAREGQALLLASLDAPDPAVRLHAAYYFGRLPDPSPWSGEAERVRAALDAYRRDDPAAMYLVQALGRLGSPEDAARLRRWLASATDWRTRVNAAAALGSVPADPDSRAALLEALDDASEHVAVAAGQSLTRAPALPSELQRMKAWLVANPGRWQAGAPLLTLLAQGDEREAVFGWVDALPPDDPYRWSAGLQALAFLPGADVLARLQEAVASSDPRIQGAAVSALVQRWSQDRAYNANHDLYFRILVRVLHGESLQAAFSAAQTLGDPAFAAFGSVGVLVDAYRGMRLPHQLEPMLAVVEALARTGAPEAMPVLEEAAVSPQGALREAAARGLRAQGREVPEYRGTTAEATASGPAAGPPSVDWPALAALGSAPVLVLETEEGTVRLRLRPEEAPLTVQTMTRLASEGSFDGVPFHRVVPNFVVQGGDFSSGDGFGGPGFTITSEFTLLPFLEGVAGMASAGKDTEGSQFFITHAMQPHLDGGFTTFGWVVQGRDVVDRLQVGDRIVRASVEPGA